MKTNDELNEQELDSISGCKSNLEDYLKTITGNDKNKTLVDAGAGEKLDLNPGTSYDGDANPYIVKRDENIPEE